MALLPSLLHRRDFGSILFIPGVPLFNLTFLLPEAIMFAGAYHPCTNKVQAQYPSFIV